MGLVELAAVLVDFVYCPDIQQALVRGKECSECLLPESKPLILFIWVLGFELVVQEGDNLRRTHAGRVAGADGLGCSTAGWWIIRDPCC